MKRAGEPVRPEELEADGIGIEPDTGDLGEPDAEFRRRARPVRVRRRRRTDWAQWVRRGWKPTLIGVALIGVGVGLNQYLFHSDWFVLSGSNQIAVSGAHYVDTAQIKRVFGADLGRNVFFIPLAERRASIAALPWVRSAAVMRVLPNRIQVHIVERQPVAFARAGDRLMLISAAGVVLKPPASANFSFPVLDGLAGVNVADPDTPERIAERQAAMKDFAALSAALDQNGADHIKDFSEINLSDPSDVQARVAVPGENGATTLIHFGDTNFGPRYQLFLSQIGNWWQKYPNLVSVDLHYDGEAIVDPGPATTAATAGAKPDTAATTGSSRGGARR